MKLLLPNLNILIEYKTFRIPFTVYTNLVCFSVYSSLPLRISRLIHHQEVGNPKI